MRPGSDGALLHRADGDGGALDLTDLPYRQDDPRWADDVMWDRDLVIEADTRLNGRPREHAAGLLRRFDDGNTIGNEGCLLTCLAMVLRLLGPAREEPWTPGTLNETAQELSYYTRSGLAMQTLYADLVAEVTEGAVQLALKEEYLPGVAGWPRVRASTSSLVRAYRRLPRAERADLLVLLKTGTYDDTVASHYVLLHPHDAGPLDDPDPEVLDPARPRGGDAPWRLTDSARHITRDPAIAAGWAELGIEPTQVGGAWVFARWRAGRALVAPLVHAWAAELARARR